jgi:hypothetical protein
MSSTSPADSAEYVDARGQAVSQTSDRVLALLQQLEPSIDDQYMIPTTNPEIYSADMAEQGRWLLLYLGIGPKSRFNLDGMHHCECNPGYNDWGSHQSRSHGRCSCQK